MTGRRDSAGGERAPGAKRGDEVICGGLVRVGTPEPWRLESALSAVTLRETAGAMPCRRPRRVRPSAAASRAAASRTGRGLSLRADVHAAVESPGVFVPVPGRVEPAARGPFAKLARADPRKRCWRDARRQPGMPRAEREVVLLGAARSACPTSECAPARVRTTRTDRPRRCSSRLLPRASSSKPNFGASFSV